MKRALLLTTLILPLAVGCTEESGAAEPSAAQQVAERITTAVPRAGVATELGLLRGAVTLHSRLNGAPPARLTDLETVSRLKYPDEYDYDAATGTVKSRSFPDL